MQHKTLKKIISYKWKYSSLSCWQYRIMLYFHILSYTFHVLFRFCFRLVWLLQNTVKLDLFYMKIKHLLVLYVIILL